MSKTQGLNVFKGFQSPQVRKNSKILLNLLFFQCVAKNIERWLNICRRSSPIFIFIFSKIHKFATKNKHCLQNPKRIFLRKSTNFASFQVPFFLGFANYRQWVLPCCQNKEGFPTFSTCLSDLNPNNVAQ